MPALLPPRWKDLESDERYGQLNATQRLGVFNKWLTDASAYGTENKWWDDEKTTENFKGLVKTKLSELSQASFDENKIGGLEDVKDAATRAGAELLATPRRANQAASDVLLGLSKAIDFVPGLVAQGLNKAFGTEFKVDSWLTNQLRKTSESNQARLDEVNQQNQAIGGGELGELAGGLAAAAGDAAVDVGGAMLTGGASVPGAIARRTPGVFRGVLDDLAENFVGPSGRQLRIASTMGAGRSYSGTWNDAIREYTDLGFSREEAEAKATPEALNAGAATYLITMLGGKTGVESVLKNSGAQGLRGRVKEVLTESFSEGLEEGADQSLQDLNERFIRNPDKAAEDSYKEIKYAFGLGTLLGGGFSAVGQTVENLRESDAPETAEALANKGWWEDPETTAQKLTEIKAQLDRDFGPDDEGRIDEQIDNLEEQEGVDEQRQQAAAQPTPVPQEQPSPPAPGVAVALPPQRMGVQTLPDDTETAPEVDESADVFANAPKQQPPVAEPFEPPQAPSTEANRNIAPAPQPEPQPPSAVSRITGPKRAANVSDETARKIQNREPLTADEFGRAAVSFEFGDAIREYFPSGEGAVWVGREESERLGAQRNAEIAATSRRIDENIAAQQRAAATPPPEPALLPPPQPSQPPAPTVNILPTGTDAALPPQRMASQQLPDDTATAPVVDETGDVFSGVQRQVAVAPTQPTATAPEPAANQSRPVNTTTTPAPASLSAAPPVAPAPTPDAQAFEDSLVEEARSAGTNVTGRTSLEIKEAIKGKGWYPKTNINKAVAEIKNRVRQRREAEAALPQSPAPATSDTTAQALPENARQLIEENRSKGAVPTSASINARFGNAPVEQRQAIRREAVRQVAQDFGIAYSDDLDFNPDFDGNASIPVRVTATGTEPVFVNNPTVTAKQIDAGLAPIVPENQRASVAEGIEFDPDTGRVTSAFARGVTVTSPGQLESAVKAQRPGSTLNPERTLTTEADTNRASSAVKKFNKAEQAEFAAAQRQFQGMRATSEAIEAAFGQADLVAKAESIWAHERAKDKQRPKDKRKNYTAAQVWNFTMEKAAQRLKTMPKQESFDAPVSESGTRTRGETVADETGADSGADTEGRGAFSAAAEEADSIEEGVAKDEVTEGGVDTRGKSGTGMTYTQAYNIINSPRVREQLGNDSTAKQLRQEAQEVLAAAEPLIETLENDDVDYWDFKIEDFENVDTGNPGTIISSSRQAKSPYIEQQRSWFEDVARAMGVRRANALTPEQHGTLARYFAEKYRPYFEAGNTTLPVDAVGQDLPELQARMTATEGAASEYRAVIDKLKAEFPGARVVFSASQNATAWYHPRYRDTIFINPLLLEQEVNGLTDSEATPFIRALMQEEYIHMVESQSIPREWVMAIGQRLGGRVRQRVLDEYVPTDMFEDPAERQAVIDSLDDYAIGSEYLRMLMQRMQSGRSTEDLNPQNLPQDILQRIMEMLRAVVRRLRAQLEVARDPVLAHTIRALNSNMRILELQSRTNGAVSQADLQPLFARPRAKKKAADPDVFDIDDIDNMLPPGNGWLRPDGTWVAAETISAGDQVQGWEAEMGQFGGHEAAAMEFLSLNDPNAYALLQDQLNSPDAFERGYEVVTDYMRKLGWLRVVQEDGDRIVFNGVANKEQERALFMSAIADEKRLVADNGRRTETIYEPPTDIRFARPRGRARIDKPTIANITSVYATDRNLNEAARVSKRGDRPIRPPQEGQFVSVQEGTQRYRHNLQVRRNQAEALTQWARSRGLLKSNAEFESRWQAYREQYIREHPDIDPDEVANGVEHDVYFDEPSQRWFKRAKGMTVTAPSMFVSYDQYMDRLAAHMALFPDTAPTLEGFVEYEFEEGGQLQRELAPVISQPHVEAERGATREETIKFMEARGFKMTRPQDKRNGHKNWINNEGVIVEDLHNENIVVTPEGDIQVIDPVIYLPESFNPVDEGIRFARPGNRIRGRKVGVPVRGKGGVWSNIKAIVTGDFSATKSKTGGWFSSGKLTPFERDIVQKPRQKIASEAAATEFTIQEFRRAIKAVYGKGEVPTETINRALGSTENPLTDTQMAELRKIRDKEEREAKKAEFKSLNREAARADRATALGELPPKVASALSRMRDKIDSLSRRMIEGGYIPESLVPVFDENMDIYLHREYLIFQNPEWKENMLNPKTEEQARIRAAAERLFVERAIAEEAVRLRRIAKEQGQPISKDEAKKRAKASTDVITRRASDLAVEYLSVADENSRMFFMGTLPAGKRNLSIIKVRGQIPKEIRAFWGEINDAETNFAQTVAKMSAFMAQHDAATELLQHGIENGYIWKRDHDNRSVFNGETRKWDVILAGQRQTGFASKEDAEKWRLAELPKVQEQLQSVAPPAGYVHLIKPGSANPKAIEPLNDAYGPPELADALAQMVTPRESSGFYRGVSFMTAMFMAMKTIGYFPQAYVRNFLSNPFGQLISGGINVQNWGSMLSALREGTRVARLNSGLRGAMDKVGPTQELREKLLRLGVMSDNPRGTMLKDLYEKGIEGQAIQELLNRKDFKTFGEKLGVKAVQTANKAFQKMADIYNGIDDQWKVFGWLMEVQNQRRAHPDWTQDQIEQKAAENIRDMVWTYSMSPEITKSVRRIPVLAPFITWTSEVIRATSNAVAVANEEMRVGKATGNKAMYRNGVNRRAGQIVAFTALPALALAMRSMLGYDEEDEEAVRSTLPEWQKNAQIVLLGQSDEGKQVFVDLSYLDPLQVFKEPLIAMMRAIRGGGNPFDVAAAGFTEALKPVFSEQLFAGAMFDIARNTTAEGRRIWNPTDTASNKTSAMIWHVIERGGPGFAVGTIPRIYKAATGTVSPSGRSFNLGAELAAPFTGQRIQEVDAQTSLRQAVSRFKSFDTNATQLLSNYMTSRGTVNLNDIPAAYDNANRAKREAFEELLKVYNSALRLGTPENIARQTLMGMGRDSGLSREDAAMIIQGTYRNWRPSRQMYDLTVTRDGGRERIRALMDHLREVNQQQGN